MKKAFLLIIAMLICAICLSSCCCCTSMFQNEEETEGENPYISTNGLEVNAYYSGETGYEQLGSAPLFSEEFFWEPGMTYTTSIKIESQENLICQYRFYLIAEDADTNGDVDIRDVISVYMIDINDLTIIGGRLTLDSKYYVGTLAECERGEWAYIYPGETIEFYVVLRMRVDASNQYQGMSLNNVYGGVEVTQLSAESDAY